MGSNIPLSLRNVKSHEAKEVVSIAKIHNWKPRVLGQAEMITEPVYMDEWWFVPLQEDRSHIPTSARHKVKVLLEAGVKPQGFIVAHEAPKVLAKPKRTYQPPEVPWEKVAKAVGWSVAALATVVSAAALLVAYAIGSAALVDPCLIMVLDDGTWIEIERWDA